MDANCNSQGKAGRNDRLIEGGNQKISQTFKPGDKRQLMYTVKCLSIYKMREQGGEASSRHIHKPLPQRVPVVSILIPYYYHHDPDSTYTRVPAAATNTTPQVILGHSVRRRSAATLSRVTVLQPPIRPGATPGSVWKCLPNKQPVPLGDDLVGPPFTISFSKRSNGPSSGRKPD